MPIMNDAPLCKKCGGLLEIVDYGDQEFHTDEAWQEVTGRCAECGEESTLFAVYKFVGFEQED